MVRTSSPVPLRSPSPHTLLTTLSDPLHQRQPASIRRSLSADQQQQERPSSSSSCHASLPHPSTPALGTRSPSRRKLPTIPAGAANSKFPSVIRITRAQLQQVMSPSRSCSFTKQNTHYSPSLLFFITSLTSRHTSAVSVHNSFLFFEFQLLFSSSLCFLGLAIVLLSGSSLLKPGRALCRPDRAWSDVSSCLDMCSCDLNRGVFV